MKEKNKIIFNEDRARKQVVMSKLYLILRENKDPMVAMAIMVNSIPQWYEFLTTIPRKESVEAGSI